MRRFSALVAATVLEVLNEPLGLLVLLSSLAIAVFAPVLHVHQFGEPTRMARDAGFSALLLGGAVFAVSAALRSFRREVETGTMDMALSHSVSRTQFFCAKMAGCALAYLHFALVVGSLSFVMVNGASIGGSIALEEGGIARIWGPACAVAFSALCAPLVLAAMANRFWRKRFVLLAHLLMWLFVLAVFFCKIDWALLLQWLPVAVLMALPPFVLLLATGAFAIRLRTPQALVCLGFVTLLFLPAVGNYCLSDALTNGGTLSLPYFFWAVLAMLPLCGAFLALGVVLANGRSGQ